MSLQIQDFTPFAEMSEGEFYEYFKGKCNKTTSIKDIYKKEKRKHNQRVRKIERSGKKRKQAKSNTATD